MCPTREAFLLQLKISALEVHTTPSSWLGRAFFLGTHRGNSPTIRRFPLCSTLSAISKLPLRRELGFASDLRAEVILLHFFMECISDSLSPESSRREDGRNLRAGLYGVRHSSGRYRGRGLKVANDGVLPKLVLAAGHGHAEQPLVIGYITILVSPVL